MATHQIMYLIGALVSAWLLLCWIDSKYKMRLIDWLNGECANPFVESKGVSSKEPATTLKLKDEEIAQLKARVQVLEKVVTEPAYELNKKINGL